MTAKKEFSAALALLASSLFVSSAIIVHAQTTTLDTTQVQLTATATTSVVSTATQGITFPVPELGDCSNKENCRNYCNQPGNIDACVVFAKAHGLMNKEEADRAVNFRKILQAGKAPGGCSGPEECKSFCSNISNISACVNFAKSNNLKSDNDEEFSKAEKIAEYIKGGGQTPGGCTTKESCSAYCGDFSHAQECFDFAQKAGIEQNRGNGEGLENGIPSGQFQKFLEFVKNNQTPGGCKSKDACENYCSDSSHATECLKFGKDIGVVSQEHADKLEKLGGKGPGGCTSKESCGAYCNDPQHRDECFKFAEDNGFIPKEQIQQMKTGLTQMLMGTSQMPPEVAACVKSILGASSTENIQSSQIVPGEEVSGKIKDCFEKFVQAQRDTSKKAFQNMPENVRSCLQQKLGDKFSGIVSGQAQTSPTDAEAFRGCSEQVREIKNSIPGTSAGIAEYFKNAPPPVAKCVKEKLGDSADKIISGQQQPSSDNMEKIKECFNEMQKQRPPMMPFASGTQMMPQAFPNPKETENQFRGGIIPKLDTNNLPPQVADCVKKSAEGESDSEKLSDSDIRENLAKCLRQFQGTSAPTVSFPTGQNPFSQQQIPKPITAPNITAPTVIPQSVAPQQ